MIPLWYKDRQGKYHNFPYEELYPNPNGIPCVDAWGTMQRPAWKLFSENADIRDYFDYHPSTDRWLLKEKYR